MPNIENSEEHGPSTPLRDHPSTPLRDHPSTPLRDHPSTPLRDHPSTPPLMDQCEAEAQTDAERQEPTPYHCAAVNAIFYRLHEYEENGDVDLIDEHRLSKEPLRIDAIVVKKNRDIELAPRWAKFFRGHNIIEYKSPVDNPPTLAVFDKLIGYARIYAAQEEVKISDMTATLICADPPETLFKILEDEFDYDILQKDDGIYYIIQRGVAIEKNLAIQVAVQKSELLLQVLDKKVLDEAAADEWKEFLLTEARIHMNKLGYWLRAIPPENVQYLFERIKDMTTQEVLMGIMETSGLSEHLMQKGMQKGRQEGRQEGALEVITLLEKGYSLADAKKKLNLETAECAAN